MIQDIAEKFKGTFPTVLPDLIPIETEAGWWPIIGDMLKSIEEHVVARKGESLTVSMIREKYGTVRVAFKGQTDGMILNMLDKAENLCYNTCEMCGKPGTHCFQHNSPFGWQKTLCAKHQLKMAYGPPKWRNDDILEDM